MLTAEQLEQSVLRLVAAGRDAQYIADLTGLPRHRVVSIAAAARPVRPRPMRGPDRRPRGPQQPDERGRVTVSFRMPVRLADAARVEARVREVALGEVFGAAMAAYLEAQGRVLS